MKKRVDLTEQDVADYIAGTTLQEIANRYNVSRHTITRKMRETGRDDVRALIKERALNGAAKLTPAQIEEIVKRCKAGEHPRDICGEYGVIPDTIRWHLRKLSVTPTRATRRVKTVENTERLLLIPDTPVTRALKLMRCFSA